MNELIHLKQIIQEWSDQCIKRYNEIKGSGTKVELYYYTNAECYKGIINTIDQLIEGIKEENQIK